VSTPTATPSPTRTPIPTPTPAPVIGLMTGNVWLREGPSADSPRLGVILERGMKVELLAVFSGWCRVRWVPEAGVEVIGWVPLQWVGTTVAIPAHMVTPTIGP
jgi:SH3-like domain-containing protein